VAFALSDVIALRSCGLAATLAAGLDDLSPPQVERLCHTFQLMRHMSWREEAEWRPPQEGPLDLDRGLSGGESHTTEFGTIGSNEENATESIRPLASELPWQLAFLGWSPSRLDPGIPPGLESVAAHFRRLQKLLGLDVSDLSYWRATAVEIERLQYFARHRDASGFRNVLADSMTKSRGQPLMHVGGQPLPSTDRCEDLPTALMRLYGSSIPKHGRVDATERQSAWRDMERLLDTQVIQPLLNEAAVAPGALERSLWLMAANLSRVFHLNAAAVQQKLSTAARRYCADGSDVPLSEIKQLLFVVDRLLAAAREIERCHEPPPTRVIPSRLMSRPSRRLSHDSG
jgi:hypothetical protein